MRHRIIIECGKIGRHLIEGLVTAVSLTMEKHAKDEDVLMAAEELKPAEKASRAQVRYAARASEDVLKALGSKTVQGVLFTHILKGAKTTRELIEITGYTQKSVESGVHKLKVAEIIAPEPIKEG
jgi:hypothetical protein